MDAASRKPVSHIDSFRLYGDVKVTIDKPADFKKNKETIITFFVFPNGNTTEQTMGKRMLPGDDWHFDIQHIGTDKVYTPTNEEKELCCHLPGNNNYKLCMETEASRVDRHEIPHLIDSLAGLSKSRKEVYT